MPPDRKRGRIYKVLFSPEAEQDLIDIYAFIAGRADADRAFAFISRIEMYCRGFGAFPERGIRRDDLRPGLRVTSFQKRVTIAFHLNDDSVIFDRFLYAGRSIDLAFESDD